MSPHTATAARTSAPSFSGPLVWRKVVDWLSADGVISAEEAQRTIARCSQAESSQHPLVRLAAVSMRRAADQKPLDIEMLTQWLSLRAALDYLRIDPLKVDVGKVADAMGAAYAERHKILPVVVTPSEITVATSEPFITDWVAEVERQSRRSVKRVVASPQEITRYTAEFYALAHSVRDSLGRAYNRTEFVEQRRTMLQAWADYLDQLRLGEVVARRSKVKQAGPERFQRT